VLVFPFDQLIHFFIGGRHYRRSVSLIEGSKSPGFSAVFI